jgi:hypothetical protein
VRSEVPYRLDPDAFSALERLLGDDVHAAEREVIGRATRAPGP